MREVLQDLESLLDDRVALLALDVGDEADATSVVLIARVVQAMLLGMPVFVSHRTAPERSEK